MILCNYVKILFLQKRKQKTKNKNNKKKMLACNDVIKGGYVSRATTILSNPKYLEQPRIKIL